jgi:hypothetical protein
MSDQPTYEKNPGVISRVTDLYHQVMSHEAQLLSSVQNHTATTADYAEVGAQVFVGLALAKLGGEALASKVAPAIERFSKPVSEGLSESQTFRAGAANNTFDSGRVGFLDAFPKGKLEPPDLGNFRFREPSLSGTSAAEPHMPSLSERLKAVRAYSSEELGLRSSSATTESTLSTVEKNLNLGELQPEIKSPKIDIGGNGLK